MINGRPRKLGIWSSKLLRLYHFLGYDMNVLAQLFGISKRTVYRYITKGGYNVKKALRKNSQDN